MMHRIPYHAAPGLTRGLAVSCVIAVPAQGRDGGGSDTAELAR